jgi:signal transduction histidine kinase/DNA-binding response OmpR family regulator
MKEFATQSETKKHLSFFRSIKGKLVLLFLAVSLIPLTIVGSVAITQLHATKNAANEVSQNYFPSIINLDNAEIALMRIIKAQKNHIIAPDDATMRALETEIQIQRDKLFTSLKAFEVTLDKGLETEAFKRFEGVLKDFLQKNEQVILLSQSNTDDEAQALSVGTVNDKFEEAFGLMETMRETNVVGSQQANLAADKAAYLGILVTLITSLIITFAVIIVAFMVSTSIAKPIVLITQAVRLFVTGNMKLSGLNHTELEKITYHRDEMGQIGLAFNTLISYFQELIGDIVRISQELVEGKQTVKSGVEYRGDFAQIKHALEAASVKLVDITNQNARQDWLKTGQSQLNDRLRGEQKLATLAKNIIAFLTTYLEAQVGLFYLLQEPEDGKPYLSIIASYGYTPRQNVPHQFLLGEGLVGEAALEKRTISHIHTQEVCSEIIQSGLAKSAPRHIHLIPILYEDTVKGVIELGCAEALTDIQREFIEQIMSNIGIAVNTAQSRTQMQELLEQSQQQTEILQTQQEDLQRKQAELQQTNKELQYQSEELQSQSEELETQQEELRHANDELEERTKALEQQKAEIQNKNKTLEKTQSEMEQAKVAIEAKAKELEIASQYKSEFLANMSHELRTPLNSLLILAQLLASNKQENLTEQQIEYAKTIHSAGADLLELINEILDLSKIEAGRMELHLEQFSLSELVETIEHKFQPLASEKGINFLIQMASDLPIILQTDQQRLKQIINNLLSNAFKFTQQGHITLEIRQIAANEDIGIVGVDLEKALAISVTDTGIGIPKHKQRIIFEAFQQMDGTTSRQYGGTGLGLSISRQLAQLLGGDILLHSEVNKGSTFTLYLPDNLLVSNDLSNPSTTETKVVHSVQETVKSVVNASYETEPQVVEPCSSDQAVNQAPKLAMMVDDRENIGLDDKSILMIEDDQKFSKILMELAQEKGFKCIITGNGETGLQFAEQYQPNAIILDVGLPHLDGLAVMERLKDNIHTRHIPIHVISAAERQLEAKKMGAIGYLHKPINMEQLEEALVQIGKFITRKVKNLLVIADSESHQQNILSLVKTEDVDIRVAVTIKSALLHLKTARFDCIILDLDVEQHSGSKLLDEILEAGFSQTPVISYTNRDLTQEEETLLSQCMDRLPVKLVKSPERLLDETTLFLHQIEANLPKDKRNMLQMIHDKTLILKEKKVLIVDDDMRNIFALATVLEEYDMEIIKASNGNEALEKLEAHPQIAIVLMDIMMPEMDGYEATRQIRAQEKFRKLPIIALTAKAMKGDRAKCIEAGANDYLSKPVDTEKLISLMRVWLYQ